MMGFKARKVERMLREMSDEEREHALSRMPFGRLEELGSHSEFIKKLLPARAEKEFDSMVKALGSRTFLFPPRKEFEHALEIARRYGLGPEKEAAAIGAYRSSLQKSLDMYKGLGMWQAALDESVKLEGWKSAATKEIAQKVYAEAGYYMKKGNSYEHVSYEDAAFVALKADLGQDKVETMVGKALMHIARSGYDMKLFTNLFGRLGIKDEDARTYAARVYDALLLAENKYGTPLSPTAARIARDFGLGEEKVRKAAELGYKQYIDDYMTQKAQDIAAEFSLGKEKERYAKYLRKLGG